MFWQTSPSLSLQRPPDRMTLTNSTQKVARLKSVTDPDGDNLSFLWFHYPEAGSYQGKIKMGAENVQRVYVTAPKVEKEEIAHFILKLSDKGTPILTRYKRVIVTIKPE